ncbi:MAG: hypothetical protein AB9888_08095 [Bacteroidales bacterium]
MIKKINSINKGRSKVPVLQQYLKKALENSSLANYSFTSKTFKINEISNSAYNNQIMGIYKKLGGICQQYPYRIGRWDMNINGLVIEFDEEQHFNRYRLETLNSKIYDEIPMLKEYKIFCTSYENKCLNKASYGGYWKNNSCIQQFGPAGQSRDLDGLGSPRWKQRAFYDFLKDIGCHICEIKMVRVPIYLSEYIEVRESNYENQKVEELVKWILRQV